MKVEMCVPVDKVSQYTFTKVIIDYLEEQFLCQLCMACYTIHRSCGIEQTPQNISCVSSQLAA